MCVLLMFLLHIVTSCSFLAYITRCESIMAIPRDTNLRKSHMSEVIMWIPLQFLSHLVTPYSFLAYNARYESILIIPRDTNLNKLHECPLKGPF